MSDPTQILNHERLIIVLGMARAGTTIFTYVLCRHPQITLFRGGPEAWVLENHCLLRRNAKRIEKVATLFPRSKYVVLKRPWQEEHGEWFKAHMPHAHFIVMLRDREGIKKSWNSTGRWAIGNRPEAATDPDAYYDRYHEHALALSKLVGPKQVRFVQYERMIVRPHEVFSDLAQWLGLENWFDCSPIEAGQHWRRKLADEFPRGDWILDGPPQERA